MEEERPSAPEIRAHLDEIRRSDRFATCERLMTLLAFLVEESLAGRQRGLKEIVIGNAVYQRNPTYDPRIDSTVRVEARRLRLRLGDFYAGEGRACPIRILLAPGSYVPAFEVRDVAALDAATAPADAVAGGRNIFVPGAGAAIAVMPFQVLSDQPGDRAFAEGLADELSYRLQSAPGLRVVSPCALREDRPCILSEEAGRLGVAALIQGTLRRTGESARATIEIVDPQGFCVWVERFDVAAPLSVELQERIATSVRSRLRFDSSDMRAARVSPGQGALPALATVLRGRQLLDAQTPSSLTVALGQFEEVAAAAPDYARGHAGTADCHLDLWRLGAIGAADARAAVAAATRAALAIDPRSLEAETAETAARALIEDDPAALDALARAQRRAEDPRGLRHLALAALLAGAVDQGLLAAAEARALDPFSTHQDVVEALLLFHARRHDALLALESGHPEVVYHQLVARARAGDAAGVRARLPGLEREAAPFPHLRCASEELSALLGTPGVDTPSALAPTDFARAAAATSAGDQDAASAFLARAGAAGEFPALLWRSDPRFEGLADDVAARGDRAARRGTLAA